MKYLPLLVIGLLATPAFADDVNVRAKPLPNETAISGTVAVDLTCLIESDASLKDCRLADGATATKHDEDAAVTFINAKGHVTGAFVAGYRTTVKVTLNVGHALPLLPIR